MEDFKILETKVLGNVQTLKAETKKYLDRKADNRDFDYLKKNKADIE